RQMVPAGAGSGDGQSTPPMHFVTPSHTPFVFWPAHTYEFGRRAWFGGHTAADGVVPPGHMPGTSQDPREARHWPATPKANIVDGPPYRSAGHCCVLAAQFCVDASHEQYSGTSHVLPSAASAGGRHDCPATRPAERANVVAAQVPLPVLLHVAPFCTIDRNDLFFSYRQEKQRHGRVGRLMSVIGTRE